MLANIISQTIIDEVIGNSEDSLPNKIKEKEESLQNTLNNRLTIPMAMQEDDKAKSNDNDYKENAISYNEDVVENQKSFELNYFSDTKLLDGSEKPINVKEHMIINMDKKYSKLFNEYAGSVSSKEDQYENAEAVDNSIEQTEFETPDYNDLESEASHYGIPADIEQILVNTVDFDTTVVAINQTREKFKNVAEQANKAEHDAEESDKLLEKISNEYNEVEKQLREKELRSKSMEQKILSLLNNEQNRLSQQLHEKENVINNANRRKEENNDKIVDFKAKINSTLEKANEYDEMISKQEELLNTLVGFNMNFDEKIDEDKNVSKVA